MGGGKWTRLTDETLAMDVASDPKDPTRIVMVTSQDPFNDLAGGNGVWMSADDGKTWSRHVGGLAMLRANCVEFDPKGGERLLVGTYGRGFFEAVWPRDYRPVGEERGYSVVAGAVVAPDATPGKSGGAGVAGGGHMVQDFMQRGLDYTYGKSWPEGNAVRSDAAGAGGLVIDATEHGGGGIVLGKQDIAPHDETRLVLRLRVMPGNEAERIAVNLIDLPGGTQTMTFMLPAVSEKMSEVSVDLPKLPAGARYTPAQMQIQGTNFSDAARKLRVVIGSVRTAGGKADDDVKVDASPFKAPVKGLPNTPAPGFWADHPAAWQAMFNGQVARAKEGNIDVVLLGDSITQGWGDTSKGRWKTALPGLTTVNFGIGGDTTRQVLYRIEHGLLDGYKAKLVVLKIGTNNLYNDANSGSDEEVADGIKACVLAIREKQPGAKVLVLSVLPRQNGYFIGRINHVNELIKGVGDEKSVYYRDIGGSFKVSETEVKKEYYTGDELHLGEAGYDHFIEVLTPIVRELTR
jgi:lysophospholipase L1-like esterase